MLVTIYPQVAVKRQVQLKDIPQGKVFLAKLSGDPIARAYVRPVNLDASVIQFDSMEYKTVGEYQILVDYELIRKSELILQR